MKRICKNCGREGEVPSNAPPCVTPEGWYALMQADLGAQRVELRQNTYYFCSKSCIEASIGKDIPDIPKTFRKAFGE